MKALETNAKGSPPFQPTMDSAWIARFHHFVNIEVRYWETDSAHHVNHVSLPAYLEHGLLKLLAHVGDPEPVARFSFEHVTAELLVRYIAPCVFGETLRVWSRVDHIGRSSVVIEQMIMGEDDSIRTVARTVIVRTSGGRSAPWTDAQRTALLASITPAPMKM